MVSFQKLMMLLTENIITAMVQEKLIPKLPAQLLSMLLEVKPLDNISKLLMVKVLLLLNLDLMVLTSDFNLLTHTHKSGLPNTDTQLLLTKLESKLEHSQEASHA